MSPELDLTTTRRAATTVLTAAGEIDLATAAELQQELSAAVATGDTVLDVTGVDFIDSTGLRVVISADEDARAEDRRFGLVVADGPVTKLLRITGVGEKLRVFTSLDDALGDAPAS